MAPETPLGQVISDYLQALPEGHPNRAAFNALLDRKVAEYRMLTEGGFASSSPFDRRWLNTTLASDRPVHLTPVSPGQPETYPVHLRELNNDGTYRAEIRFHDGLSAEPFRYPVTLRPYPSQGANAGDNDMIWVAPIRR